MNEPQSQDPSRRDRVGALAAALVLVAALVLALSVRQIDRLPDFGGIDDTKERKLAFFAYLAPMVEAENDRVRVQRRRLQALARRLDSGRELGAADQRWLARLADEYELEWPGASLEERIERLKLRVDTVPVSLALMQAAAESGWGRSRFAVEANNLFGQWCYTPGCGLVPNRRNERARHEVALFPTVRESVRRYVNNLNTHSAYAPLRRIRAERRAAGEPLRGADLADGLLRYSERREDYVDEIKQGIRSNRPLISEVAELPPGREP